MSDKELEYVQIAERIVKELFINGQGSKADRLVLTTSDGRDLGGWCERAVVDVIVNGLKEASNG